VSNDEITVFCSGDSIISFIACFGGGSVQPASNNRDRSAGLIVTDSIYLIHAAGRVKRITSMGACPA
jgi:hypothetical protein